MGLQANMNALMKSISEDVEKQLSGEIAKVREDLEKTVIDVNEKIASGVSLRVEYNGKETEIKGLKHKNFEKLLLAVSQKLPVMLVGQAGSGKTHAVQQVAEALGLNFASMSVGSQTSKTDLTGYKTATGTYVATDFVETYEKGGVYCLDEIDAGNSNVTILLNSALSNGFLSTPNGMVKMHKDFVFVATANTFGHGASREYVGRNQLDASTLDRFVTIEWDLDAKLEEMMVKPYTHGEVWLKTIRRVREYSESNGIRILITPRATIYGAKLLEAGMKPMAVIESTIVKSAPAKSRTDIGVLANNVFGEK
jgi:cobaltochelatase CobS